MSNITSFRNQAIALLCLQLTQVFAPAISSANPEKTYSEKETIDRLSIPLEEIGSDARSGRKWGGGILLGSGVLMMGAGLFVNSDSASYLASGALLASAGGLILALPTEYERLPAEYARMPFATSEEQNAKIAKGETFLTRLGERSKNDRVTGGVLMLGLGAACLAMAASMDGGGFLGISSSVRSLYVYEGVIFAGLGAAELFSENSPERGSRLYREWKNEGRRSALSLRGFAFIPARRGLAFGPSWRF